jgi:hypothetical protein
VMLDLLDKVLGLHLLHKAHHAAVVVPHIRVPLMLCARGTKYP